MALDREKVRDALLPHMALFHSINVPLGLQDAVLALVAREVAAAVEGERERCAKVRVVLAGYGKGYETSDRRVAYHRGWNESQKRMAAAIRAPQPGAGSGE